MNALPPLKKPRNELAAGEILCHFCTAKCCRYFALPIEKPTNLEAFGYIRWYLLHDRATIFIDDGVWYLLVHTECRHLQPDHRCGIYDTRPLICREYSTENCEYEDDHTYDGYFELAEQVEEFVDALYHSDPQDPHFRSPRPTPFPIIGHISGNGTLASASRSS
ncbi:MAG TPA: YkgJ family cysteine cluster protein [Pirellulaceae bacterium]|nr:YkgJ family cysteine cluster protein [Pirellulaceae bacterium]